MVRPELTVAIPVYDEEANLVPLHRRLGEALAGACDDYEILFVDDGSRDGSAAVIEGLIESDPRVRLLALSRNFGKEAAIIAGYDHARGRAVVMMDGDLQNPPELIPRMLERWRAGVQVVDTMRQATADQGLLRRLTSRGFYWLMSKLGNVELTPNAADFRLLDGRVVDELRRLREHARFNRGLVGWLGFRREVIAFTADARSAGDSRWSTWRLVTYAIDAIISFSPTPLRLAGLGGLLLSVLALLYMLSIVYVQLAHGIPVPGYATLAGGILLLGGVQLISIWFLGEYIARISEEVKQRPLYVVEREAGKAVDEGPG